MKPKELICRAWDERNKIMHYDFEYISSGYKSNDWIIFKSDKQKLEDKKVLDNPYFFQQFKIMPCAGIKSNKGKRIYKKDIIIKDEYPFKDEGKLNYIGVVEFIFSSWQIVLHCVDKNKRGISDGMNEGINDDGFKENEKSDWIILGNTYQNENLLKLKIIA